MHTTDGTPPNDRRKLGLCLDSFGRTELTELARARGTDLDGLVSQAAAQLAASLAKDRRRRDIRVPKLRTTGADAELVEVTVTLDDDDLAALQAEADDQAITLAVLVRHGAMLALAGWTPAEGVEQGYQPTGDSPDLADPDA